MGVRSKGYVGLSYYFEFVDKSGMFGEMVEQEGVGS